MKLYQLLIKFINSKLEPLTLFFERSKTTKTKIFFAGLLFAVIFFHSLSYSQVPQMVNYQGALNDSLGNRLNGDYDMTFSIYDTSDGGTPLWTETQYEVFVEGGVFNVLLSIPDSIWGGEDELIPRRYLGVSISSEPEMVPRREIGSVPYAYRAGVLGPDGDWYYPGDGTTVVPYVSLKGNWGIARYGNTLYGSATNTHINLGVSSTTGAYGQSHENCTVAGGLYNTASGNCATVGGGCGDSASGANATVGGGAGNTASGFYATIGGGWTSTASGEGATVPGGFMNTAAGDYSFAAGNQVNVDTNADYTFAFGNNFTTSASHAVIFHDTQTPIKVGIGTTSPAAELEVTAPSSATFSNILRFGMAPTGTITTRYYVYGAAGAYRSQGWTFNFNPETSTKDYAGMGALALALTSFGAGFGAWPAGFYFNYMPMGETSTWSTAMLIDHEYGRVGIGTTSPQRALHISDVLRLEPRSTFPSSPGDGDICVVGSAGSRHIYCYLNGGWRQLD